MSHKNNQITNKRLTKLSEAVNAYVNTTKKQTSIIRDLEESLTVN